MQCSYDPTFGMIPGNGSGAAWDPIIEQRKKRIAELKEFIYQYDKLDPGQGKSSLTARYLAAKEELELLEQPTETTIKPTISEIIKNNSEIYSESKIEKIFRENKTAVIIAGSGMAVLILRKLFK